MTTVVDLFAHADVPYDGVVRWGDAVPLDSPGVYVISISADPNEPDGPRDCPLDIDAVEELLRARPESTVDLAPATTTSLADRLREMWPAGEPVVYIGLAGTSARRRVEQFYRTIIGARDPHAGGWPVKMLAADSLWVHYGSTATPTAAESAMVRRFAANIPACAAQDLVDPAVPLPFANLTVPGGRRKAHGLRGVKAPKPSGEQRLGRAATVLSAPPRRGASVSLPPSTAELIHVTQNVTVTDLSNGRLRVPRVTKSILPAERARIEVELGGDIHSASWDPRTDGDRERSGVIRVSRAVLTNYITAGGPRHIEATATGYRIS